MGRRSNEGPKSNNERPLIYDNDRSAARGDLLYRRGEIQIPIADKGIAEIGKALFFRTTTAPIAAAADCLSRAPRLLVN